MTICIRTLRTICTLHILDDEFLQELYPFYENSDVHRIWFDDYFNGYLDHFNADENS